MSFCLRNDVGNYLKDVNFLSSFYTNNLCLEFTAGHLARNNLNFLSSFTRAFAPPALILEEMPLPLVKLDICAIKDLISIASLQCNGNTMN